MLTNKCKHPTEERLLYGT